MISGYGWTGLAVAAVVACGGDSPKPVPASAAVPEERARVVFLGTSLTAGFGVDPSEAYPALIQEKIDSAGLRFQVVNAGLSGETSAGALRRIEWVLRQPPAVLVIETGANDGLRGQNVDSLRSNIQAIIDRANRLTPKPRIVLVGMRMLTNYGAEYVRQFAAVYPDLARKNGIPLVPFLLQGVAGVDSLNQPDQIHPTAAGHRRLAETVWRTLAPVLEASRLPIGLEQNLPERGDGGVDLRPGIVVVG